MSQIFTLTVPVWEKVVRTLVVYAAIAVLVRLAGKRSLAQLNSFDLVVVLLLSKVVQNAIIGNDNSLTGGLLGAVVLFAVNAIVVRVRDAFGPAHGRVRGNPHNACRRRPAFAVPCTEKVCGART